MACGVFGLLVKENWLKAMALYIVSLTKCITAAPLITSGFMLGFLVEQMLDHRVPHPHSAMRILSHSYKHVICKILRSNKI